MKPATLPHAVGVSQAVAKGACPFCGILKDFQWTVAEKIEPRPALHLCNFHAWALAGSAPAENVTTVLKEYVPLKHQRLLDEGVARNRDELRQE